MEQQQHNGEHQSPSILSEALEAPQKNKQLWWFHFSELSLAKVKGQLKRM